MRSLHGAMEAARAEVRKPSAPPPRRWRGLCLGFVRTCWGIDASGIPDADAAWARARRRVGSGTPPKGAPVYWAIGRYGHIALSAGGGRVFSTDIRRRGKVDLVPIGEIARAWGAAAYRGWSHDYCGTPLPLTPPAPEEDPLAKLDRISTSTTKPTKLRPGKPSFVMLHDDGPSILGEAQSPCDWWGSVGLTIEKLPVGATLQLRFVEVDPDTGSISKGYPLSEVTGTPGATYTHLHEAGGHCDTNQRLRVLAQTWSRGVTITRSSARVLHLPT